jgi:hypothetical protein
MVTNGHGGPAALIAIKGEALTWSNGGIEGEGVNGVFTAPLR